MTETQTPTQAAKVARIEDLVGYVGEGNATWRPIRSRLGIMAFGINAYEATAADQQVVGEHDELGTGSGRHEELYLVMRGHATFTVDGEDHDAPAGTLVFVPDPASKRSAVAKEEGTLVVIVGARPGEPFAPSPWEAAAEALRFWPTEEWDKAIEALSAQAEELPESAGIRYNLACAHARAGHTDEALTWLGEALEREPRFREAAQTDEDFASIKDDPRFPAAEADA